MMKYFTCIPLCCFLLMSCADQPTHAVSRDSANILETDSLVYNPAQEKEAYIQAIACYIDSAYKDAGERPDTLFFGKHDQFPVMQLPETIHQVPVLLLTNDAYEVKTKYRKHSVFINMIGTQKINAWEFTMITLFEYAIPQHICHLNFNYDPGAKEISLDTLYFEYPYGKK